ncbi:WSC domain-containing protein [Lachnellula hyalina]|uniref:WSC domain-containing protein n=1 Tax=Lachnellula hyalina TaxID=1316788 RepID=A0A8H8QY96_9HELO|nr:WSC domain-containing protein [Lachnellula hyalina]TVY25082.1 WSC domain-containing protein [Lachnellula hyalina]
MRQPTITQLIMAFTLATTASAFFRLPCKSPLVVERADPVISPGKISGHVHSIMGGNGFGFEMDYASTQLSTCSSCTVTQDMSNYWVPTLYYKAENGSFISVGQNGGATIYYLQRSDPTDANYPHIEAFPEGFRMVAGDPMLRSYSDTNEQNAITFACLGTNTPETNGFPNIKCPDGLRVQVFFPSCWNGVDLDSANHKSHMAYPSGSDHGSCPGNFTRLVSIFYEVIWNTPDFDGLWYGDSQPFLLSSGDQTGYGYHGDFVNGWNVSTLQAAVDNCTNLSGVIEECPYFDFITDTAAQACVIPPSINEQVFGVMPNLPGCNVVQNGPAISEAQSKCEAPTQIGPFQLPYVDLTSSKGFAYVGCGSDPGGQPRTLLGVQANNATGMTVEYCVDYCVSRGFSVAGLEFSSQCFCDNSIPADRAPIPSLEPMCSAVGNCAMPCSGDSKEVCGGASLISLYQKCKGNGSPCENIHLPIINGSMSTGSTSKSPVHLQGLSSSAEPSSSALTSATSSSSVLPTEESTPATSSPFSTTSAETTPLVATSTLLTTTSISSAGYDVDTNGQSPSSTYHNHHHTHSHRARVGIQGYPTAVTA